MSHIFQPPRDEFDSFHAFLAGEDSNGSQTSAPPPATETTQVQITYEEFLERVLCVEHLEFEPEDTPKQNGKHKDPALPPLAPRASSRAPLLDVEAAILHRRDRWMEIWNDVSMQERR